MESNHVREFLRFTETMNYSRAAKQLFMTPNALSNHISKLEDEIGSTLVCNTATGLALTASGRALVRHGKQIVNSVDTAICACHEAETSSVQLTISGPTVLPIMSLLNQAAITYQEETGAKVDIATQITNLFGPAALAQSKVTDGTPWIVLESANDVGSPQSLPQTLQESIFVKSEQVVFSVPSGNELYLKEDIRAEDLDGQELLCINDKTDLDNASLLLEAFKRCGASLALNLTLASSAYDYLCSSRPNDICWWNAGTVEQYGLSSFEGFRFFSLADLPVRFNLFLLYRNRDATASFFNCVKKLANTEQRS